jgi:hypothetical protein
MTRYFSLVIAIFIGNFLFAQNANHNKGFSEGLGAADYSFNVGTEVGTTFKNSYYISNYFSPNAKFDVTKKFSLVVGIGVNYTQMNNMHIYTNEFNSMYTNANVTSFYTYASGIYKLSPRVNLNATVFLEDATFNSPESKMVMNNQYKDLSFGVNYNVTKHISFNAQMHLSDRPQNIYNPGNSQFGVSTPFNNSPFY